MKAAVKILISMFFIAGSFFLGEHFDRENCDSKKKELKDEIISLKSENIFLHAQLDKLLTARDSTKNQNQSSRKRQK